jgi:hypothetical protein
MPTRGINDSICSRKDIAGLSDAAEVLYFRLKVNADDYGRFYGDAEIIESKCFCKKKRTPVDVAESIYELEDAGIIQLYIADGIEYLQLLDWDERSIRAKNSKYPNPPINERKRMQLQTDVNECKQVQTSETDKNRLSGHVPVIVNVPDPVYDTVPEHVEEEEGSAGERAHEAVQGADGADLDDEKMRSPTEFEVKGILEHFKREIGHITPAQIESMRLAATYHPPDLIKCAITAAAKAGAKVPPSYIAATLADWKRRGLKDETALMRDIAHRDLDAMGPAPPPINIPGVQKGVANLKTGRAGR